MFRINKGCLDETDIAVNEKQLVRDIPFTQMMYIGDGITDVPCMSMLRSLGGYALAVYRPHTKTGNTHAQKLLKDDRVDNIAPADYSEGGKMDLLIKAWLQKIKAEHDLKAL